jgi:hypothetical protein
MAIDDILAAYLETGSVDEAALASLPDAERDEVHAALGRLDQVRTVLADADAWVEPDAGLEDRVVLHVTGSADPVVAVASLASGAPPSESVPPAMSLADARLRRSRLITIGASLIAAAAIIVAVVGFSTRTTEGPSGTRGPSGAEFAMAGTGLLPGASGTVHLLETNSGVRVYLDATGLPRRDNGQFYEAWAKTAHGLVALGTFHTGTDVVLWSGVSISEIDAITVTLEVDDDNQASSGQRVLLAQLR